MNRVPHDSHKEWSPPKEIAEYRLVRLLGRGAMGEVYLGHDSILDRHVAVKFLSAVSPDESQRERFLVEARAIARLQHPNVVYIYRVGEIEGRPYIVSEFIRGKSLDQFLLPLPWERVLTIAHGLARGLHAVHRSGVVHRDIKPANIMISEEGEAKLLDFGLAKLVDVLPRAPSMTGSMMESASRRDLKSMLSKALAHTSEGQVLAASPELTRTGALLGTPLYMAPEVWNGERASPRSDIYSLGAVLYEICTGGPPFQALTMEGLCRAVQQADPVPLLSISPEIAPGFGEIVERCLQRDPALRFPSAEALEQALSGLSRNNPSLAPPLPPAAAHSTTVPGAQHARSWLPWSIAGTLGLLAMVGGWELRAHRAGPKPAGTDPGGPGPLRPKMVAVPIQPGLFTMGSPEDEVGRDLDEQQHEVRITHPYLLAESEVTLGQYHQVMGDPMPGGDPNLPAVKVSWLDAVQYCNQLSHKEGLEPCYTVLSGIVGWPTGLRCRGYRLPTEAEWEYAARAGEHWVVAGGESPDAIGWYAANAQGLQRVKTRNANAWAIYDMSGNAWEWVWDWYDAYPGPSVDPLGPRLGVERVNRGGGWIDDPRQLRVANRSRNSPDVRLIILGFRIARSGPG